MTQVRRDNGSNEAKTPEENSNALSSLSDFDVTRLSEEEMSTLRDVFERQWVLQERNAEEKRYGLFFYWSLLRSYYCRKQKLIPIFFNLKSSSGSVFYFLGVLFVSIANQKAWAPNQRDGGQNYPEVSWTVKKSTVRAMCHMFQGQSSYYSSTGLWCVQKKDMYEMWQKGPSKKSYSRCNLPLYYVWPMWEFTQLVMQSLHLRIAGVSLWLHQKKNSKPFKEKGRLLKIG